MMYTLIGILAGIIAVSILVRRYAEIRSLKESKDILFKNYEFRANQNSQLYEELVRRGVTPMWDGKIGAYWFMEDKPKKKTIKRKKK